MVMEEDMAEIWDIYDRYGNRTGRTMKRGIPKEGDYMLCVHIYLLASDNRFLIQKRSENKESHPGEWDITGGAAISGESSVDAILRETEEEVGIKLDEKDLYYAGRFVKERRIIELFFAKKDFELSDCHVQKEEVDKVAFVSYDELVGDILMKRGRSREYVELVSKAAMEFLHGEKCT